MIVNNGRLAFLDAQSAFNAALQLGLFDDDIPDDAANTLASYTESSFAGYARVTLGAVTAAALVGGRGQVTPVTMPVFTNAEAFDVVVYGWFLYDTTSGDIVAAHNVGATTIPAGLSLAVPLGITDTDC